MSRENTHRVNDYTPRPIIAAFGCPITSRCAHKKRPDNIEPFPERPRITGSVYRLLWHIPDNLQTAGHHLRLSDWGLIFRPITWGPQCRPYRPHQRPKTSCVRYIRSRRLVAFSVLLYCCSSSSQNSTLRTSENGRVRKPTPSSRTVISCIGIGPSVSVTAYTVLIRPITHSALSVR